MRASDQSDLISRAYSTYQEAWQGEESSPGDWESLSPREKAAFEAMIAFVLLQADPASKVKQQILPSALTKASVEELSTIARGVADGKLEILSFEVSQGFEHKGDAFVRSEKLRYSMEVRNTPKLSYLK